MENRLEPPEEKWILDMYDREIYQGEEYYITDEGFLSKGDSVYNYAEDYVDKLTLAEIWNELLEVLSEPELAESIREILLDELSNNYEKYFEFDKEVLNDC